MRHVFRPALAALLGLLFIQQAAAQVYQCLDAGGKKVFSQAPCSSQAGKDEKLIMRAPGAAAAAVAAPAEGTPLNGQRGVLHDNGSAAPASRDWAAENAAANARAAAAAEGSGGGSRQAMPPVGGLRKGNN